MKRFIAAIAPLGLILGACAAEPEPEQPTDPPAVIEEPATSIEAPAVVVSNSILGDVVAEIVLCATGGAETVTVLMPLGSDPHDFQPSSEQVALMVRSDLVVVNGLGLETGLEGAIDAVLAEGGLVFEATNQIEPLVWTAIDDGHGHGHGHGHDHGHGHGHDHDHDHGDSGLDPHFWLDMERMALVAGAIGQQLVEITGEAAFGECGDETSAALVVAEAELIALLDGIAPERRLLVTDHEALGYFAERYGFTISGVVIPGGSTLGAPDSRELARLARVLIDNDIRAIFGNTNLNPAVLEALAAEVGGDVVVVPLFIESLGGPGSGAESYHELMLTNGARIAGALGD